MPSNQASTPSPGARERRAETEPHHALRAALARLGLRLASRLSIPTTRKLCGWLAELAISLPGRARNSMLVNLSLCFPDLSAVERGELARETLAESLATVLELGPFWSWEQPRVLSLVHEVVGRERLDEALSAGRGVVLLGPHMGAWELVGLYVSSRAPMTSLYRAPRVRGLENDYKRARERFGARLVSAEAGGVRALYRALRRGEVVGLLPDQDPGRGAGVFAPFFGVMANTSTLTARLLAHTGAKPLLAWAERLGHSGGYRMHFLEPDAEALRSPDEVQAARALNLELEQLIRERPQQYLWSYRRFRHQPPGHPSPYGRGGVAAMAGEAVRDGRMSGATP